MSTVATPAPEAQPPISQFARIVSVLFNPKSAFQDVVRRPTWVLPVLLLTIIWLGLNTVMAQRGDWVQISKDQIEKNKWAAAQIERLSEDRRAAAYEQAATRGKYSRYVRGVIGWPLLLLVASGIYYGAYRLIGGARTNFATAFSIAAFAHLPMGLRELLAIPVNLVKDPGAIDPENFLASNVAAFLGSGTPLWQVALLTGVDVFGLWTLFLIAVGFSAADPKKLPLGKSIGIAVSVWLAIVLFFTGIAWVFS